MKADLLGVIKITKDLLELQTEAEATKNKKTYPNINEIATSRGIYVGMLVEVKSILFIRSYSNLAGLVGRWRVVQSFSYIFNRRGRWSYFQ